MKEPPFQAVPTYVPCCQHNSFLTDQGEKLLSVIELGLCFSLLGLAPHTGHGTITGVGGHKTRQMRHETHIFEVSRF